LATKKPCFSCFRTELFGRVEAATDVAAAEGRLHCRDHAKAGLSLRVDIAITKSVLDAQAPMPRAVHALGKPDEICRDPLQVEIACARCRVR
jgi:hypothetical protein